VAAYTYKHGDRPLEGYTIQRGIGRGGFGEVYFAISDGGREVALKFLRDNSEIELRGVSHCMNLKSAHLVTIFDVMKNADNDYFIIMEHVSGPSLQEILIAEPNGLGVEKAAFFTREIGKGLSYLHERGIVHRDMKPANIFYEEGHVKIGDYGLSKFISVSRHSAQTTSVGTVHYMAPEVGGGNYHRGIDIYALGVMLYEMLLGKVPFEGSSMAEILMKHLTEQPEVSSLPQPFGKVIRRALEKDPNDRYQTVDEMIDDLLEVSAVRESLAGFNPSTIAITPRSPGVTGPDSPIPSPNPPRPPQAFPPRPPRGVDLGERGALPATVDKRLKKIGNLVDDRMDKLAGRRPGRQRRARARAAARTGEAPPIGRIKGIALSLILTTAGAIGLGLLVGNGTGIDVAGFSTGIMIAAMIFGLRLTTRVTRWLGSESQPPWVEKMALLLCTAPWMVMASAPLCDRYQAHGFALMLGMVATLLVADWRSRRESGASGELSFGSAISLAICGGVASAMSAGITNARNPEMFMAMGATVGGAVSLLTQAVAWFLRDANASQGQAGVVASRSPAMGPPHPGDTAGGVSQGQRRMRGESGIPFGIPIAAGATTGGVASVQPVVKMRSVIERGFFSVLVFVMFASTVSNVMYASLVNFGRNHTLIVAHIGAAIACLAIMLFAFQKLTRRRRIGFWRETLCPLLIAVFMTGVGLCITIIATGNARRDEQLALAIIGIVLGSVMLLLLLIARVWPQRKTMSTMAGTKIGFWASTGGAARTAGRAERGESIGVNITPDGAVSLNINDTADGEARA